MRTSFPDFPGDAVDTIFSAVWTPGHIGGYKQHFFMKIF